MPETGRGACLSWSEERENPQPTGGCGFSRCARAGGAQASTVSSRRLRVRVKSSGMPGPIVVASVALVM